MIHVLTIFDTIFLFLSMCNNTSILLNFSIMTKNRRFPFERSKQQISLDNFSTTEEQLYAVIRRYASVCRTSDQLPLQPVQQPIVPDDDNDRFNQLMSHLKSQQRHAHPVNTDDVVALRQDHIQHWKHVKSQWQQYYREEIRKQQEIFNRLIQSSH